MTGSSALPPRSVLWAVFAAIAVLWFVNLDNRSLLHPDEGRYGEIAREMAASGDWVTPRLNGLKYFEKPPFQYWVTAAAYRAFGVHAWAARLWPTLAGLLAVIAIGCAGFALGGAALGAFAGLALAGTVMHAMLSQAATLDSGLSFFLALAFSGFVIAQRPAASPGACRAWMWVAWAALAGATLSKGPIGVVLPGGALVAYTAITRDYALWRRLHPVSGLALYLALTAPWFIAVSHANDEFAHFFFVHEHFQRFLTDQHGRAGPWYYFVPFLIAGSLPWFPLLAYGARRAWRDGASAEPGFSWQRFALVWAAFVFLFFGASGSKLAPYILPMFAPLALVAGWLTLTLEQRPLFRLAVLGAVAIGVVALVVLAGYDPIVARLGGGQPAEIMHAYAAWVKAALVVATAGAIAATIAFRRAADGTTARFWGVAALALSALGAVHLAVAGFDVFSVTRSTSAILRAAQASAPFTPGAPFYQVAMYDQTTPFYLGRTTTLVAYRDELALGIDAEPDKQIPTVAAWLAQWRAQAQGYAMMPPVVYEWLAAEGVPMRVLARDARRVVVSRQ
jgi:4-amino-4-deoxy-L-arabinose transferase-like glycosyltransferase